MNLPIDHRAAARKPCNEEIRFSLPSGEDSPRPEDTPLHTAIVFDISATGMGLHSTTALHKGQIIHFDPTQPKWSLPPRGLIVWSLRQPSGCRVGLEFLS